MARINAMRGWQHLTKCWRFPTSDELFPSATFLAVASSEFIPLILARRPATMISYKSLSFMLAALLNAWISPSAAAADFPVRAITFVVPFSAGSAVDAYARLVAPKLSEALGQPVLVDNKEGAGGLIGAQAVLRAPADGYTYLFALPPWEYTPYFYMNPPYIPLKDFRAVARETLINRSRRARPVHA